jgi:ornithine carbamoyltransferase
MGASSHTRALTAWEQLSSVQADALVRSACELQRAAAGGRRQPLLRGKNLGLLCDDDRTQDAALFRRAATELGAHVAHIRPGFAADSAAQDVQHTARLLGRLYDAVDCEGLPHALVEVLAAEAGVPVFEGIAQAQHPSAALADSIVGDCPEADKRRYLLQALLVSVVG